MPRRLEKNMKNKIESRIEFFHWFEDMVCRRLVVRCLVEDVGPAKSLVHTHVFYSNSRNPSTYEVIYLMGQPRDFQTDIHLIVLGCSMSSVRETLDKMLDGWEKNRQMWIDPRPVIACRKKLDGRVEEISPSGFLLLQHYASFLERLFYEVKHTVKEKVPLADIFYRLNAFLIRQNEEWERVTGMKW